MADSSAKPHAASAGSSDPKTTLAASLSSADGIAAAGLRTMAGLHRARAARLTREAASSAGAASAQARKELAAEHAAVARIDMINLRAATAAPTVSPTGWALHGRVHTSDLAPAPGCTVFLVDAQNAFKTAHGFAYTDATGYFALAAQAQAEADHPEHAALFVAVANIEGRPIYRSADAFSPTPGVATYQTHILPTASAPIGEPPASIRGIALPKT